jgi:methionyl-tRNA formyltransferase
MNPIRLELGFIFFPSIRSISYLNVFKKLNCYPAEIVVLDGTIPFYEAINTKSKQLNYSENYFDTNFSLISFLEIFPAKIIKTRSSSINSSEIVSSLQSSSIKKWIFSGGGIAKSEIFNTGKEIIHIHPGILPQYRGSTTFYYSYLEKGLVGATAFFMTEQIDSGDIIEEAEFQINMRITEENAIFIDYILDPYIRGEVLAKVLKRFIEKQEIISKPLKKIKKEPYYIMHPFLRHIVVKKINNLFDKNRVEGVSMVSINND